MKVISNKYIKWGINAFVLYTLMFLAGTILNSIGHAIAMDADIFEFLANILTTSYGFISGIMGYGDFFEYSGFHVIPFILGGLVWVLVALLSCSILTDKVGTKGKTYLLGKLFLILGVVLCFLSLVVSVALSIFSDGFAILLFPLSGTVFIPLILTGIVLIIKGKKLT